MSDRSRQGYEFSKSTIRQVRERGACEFTRCQSLIQVVDHVTSIALGKRLGLSKGNLSSYSNAQGLCLFHNQVKDYRDFEALISFYEERDVVYLPAVIIKKDRANRKGVINNTIA